jgi:hypothetical protein
MCWVCVSIVASVWLFVFCDCTILTEGDLGGLVVSVLATGPKVRGFDPDRGRWIFKGDKSRSTTSFGGEVPCGRFTACNE